MHPKILIAGNTAAGIFARMLAYSGCYLTDGLVPQAIVTTIVGKDTKALQALIDMNMLEQLETGSVFIHNYLEFNRSKREVDEDRKSRRANGAKGGRPRTTA